MSMDTALDGCKVVWLPVEEGPQCVFFSALGSGIRIHQDMLGEHYEEMLVVGYAEQGSWTK